MSSKPSFPVLYHIPVLSPASSALSAPFTLLHFVDQTSCQQVQSLHQQLLSERQDLAGKIRLLHVFSGANPYQFGGWAQKLGADCEVAWLGPDFITDFRLLGLKIQSFPYFMLLEGQRLMHAGSEVEYPLASLPERVTARNLKELASSAVSLKPKDASSAVICSLVLRELIEDLPLPKPVDMVALQKQIIEKLQEELQQKEREIEEMRLTGYG